MHVKLTRSVLVGDADVFPTSGGTELEMDDVKAKEFITLGLAEETKAAPAPANKKAPEPQNKARAKDEK